MKKIAMLLADGYEEGESLFVVDILRRAGFQADIVSTTGRMVVEGAQHIKAEADRLLEADVEDYDMIVLPGGQPGANNLNANESVLELVRTFAAKGKWIAAICAAPMVLHTAGITSGRTLTSYPAEKYRTMFSEANYREDVVVVDGNLITSRGPGTTLPFAYALVDALGGDGDALREKMQWNLVCRSMLRAGECQ